LKTYDVYKWINEFLTTLIDSKKEQEMQKACLLSPSDVQLILNRYHKSSKRCILLDYDGTLAPYQKVPSLARPDADIINLLKDLAADEKNEIVIISGRDAATLEEWLGHLPLTLVAEHGAAIKKHGETWKDTVTINPEWKEQIRPLMQLFVDRCAGSFREEKKNTLAWHYRNTHPELGFNRSRELRNSLAQLLGNTMLQVIDGNKVLEVRMTGVDKGNSANNIVHQLEPDFIMCIGDDTTDEDMFRMLRDKGFTIKVCRGNTAAEFTILSQKDVYPFLNKLATPLLKQQENPALQA
jgi:trehalose 6-phosphate synthase/phosphatase